LAAKPPNCCYSLNSFLSVQKTLHLRFISCVVRVTFNVMWFMLAFCVLSFTCYGSRFALSHFALYVLRCRVRDHTCYVYVLHSTYCVLRWAFYALRVTVTCCGCVLRFVVYVSPFTFRVWCVCSTCYVLLLRVTFYVLRFKCYVLRWTVYTFCVKRKRKRET